MTSHDREIWGFPDAWLKQPWNSRIRGTKDSHENYLKITKTTIKNKQKILKKCECPTYPT